MNLNFLVQPKVNVSSSNLYFILGKLKYDINGAERSSENLELIYIIVGVVGGAFVFFVILMCCLYRRKKQQQEQKERTYEMQMNSLESKVAKECREGKVLFIVVLVQSYLCL